jgi:hypothetical protein
MDFIINGVEIFEINNSREITSLLSNPRLEKNWILDIEPIMASRNDPKDGSPNLLIQSLGAKVMPLFRSPRSDGHPRQ